MLLLVLALATSVVTVSDALFLYPLSELTVTQRVIELAQRECYAKNEVPVLHVDDIVSRYLPRHTLTQWTSAAQTVGVHTIPRGRCHLDRVLCSDYRVCGGHATHAKAFELG